MGFFDSVTGAIGGGSSSSTQTGGFNALPASIKGAYTDFGQQIQDLLNSGNLNKMYTPLAQTAGETKAYGNIDRGFAPTAETISSDIAMQQNPFDKYVIDEINRQSQGDNSILQQNLNSAGQLGSNRQFLGANDIDLSRLNQIGGFKQQNYQTALNNALTVLPGARGADAAAQLGAGANQRDLYGQTQQAPVTALQQIAKALGILPTQEGSTTSTSKSSGGIGGLLSGAASVYTATSDRDLKENVTFVGIENGHNLYEFNYIPSLNKPGRFVGVMAQEVMQTNPEAVVETPIGYAVNYSMIGVEFREVV